MKYVVIPPIANPVGRTTTFAFRMSTVFFDYLPNGLVGRHDMTIKNNETTGGICQVSGIWFPSSRLVKDGQGRMVGDIYWKGKGR